MNLKSNILRFSVLLVLLISLIIPLINPQPVAAIDWPDWWPFGNKPVEIVSERTESSKTYNNKDGTYTTKAYQCPIHYKDNYSDDNEIWKDIDTTIINGKVTKAPYILTIDSASKTIHIYNKKDGSELALQLSALEQHGVVQASNNVQSSTKNNKITWVNAYTDTDIIIEAQNDRVNFKRVLKSANAPTGAVFNFAKVGEPHLTYSASETTKIDPKMVPIQLEQTATSFTETIDTTGMRFPIVVDPTWQVSASADDAKGVAALAWLDNTSAWLEIIHTAWDYSSFVRFSNVNIPSTSTITTAYLTLTAYGDTAATVSTITIHGLDEDDVGNFPDWATANGYSLTTENTTWTPGQWFDDVEYDTPDLSDEVQEIIDRGGWAANQHMGFRTDTTGNDVSKYYTAYDSDPAKAAVLTATWTCTPPTTVSVNATSVEETTATLNANITSTGAWATADNRGFVWDTSSHGDPGDVAPVASGYADTWTEAGAFGIGAHSHGITGLTSAERYYFRSEADTDCGYDYSNDEQSFITKPYAPTSFSCASVNETCISLSWTEAVGGAGTTIKSWVQAKQDSYPADRTDGTNIYYGTDETYTHCGLGIDEHWYYRIWASAEDGALIEFSDDYVECNTYTAGSPIVTTEYCSGFGDDWAVLNGRVDDINDTSITEWGFDYGPDSSYGSSITTAGTFGSGDFADSVTGLNPASCYHYRFKATNEGGVWGYGEDKIFCTHGSPSVYEFWNMGGDTDSIITYGANWTYQTFTTNSTDIAHSITSVKLSLLRVGNPGDVTVSIRNTTNCTSVTCNCTPTGADIAYGILDGDSFNESYAWWEFEMSPEQCYAANTTYAIVVRAINGDDSNYILWEQDSGGGYPGGNAGHSYDGAVTWEDDCPADNLFEVWGEPCLAVHEAKVFSDWIEDGDWLITCMYTNTYPPYYDDQEDVSSLFYLQLVDVATVKAQTKVPEWGYKPGHIYLSPDMVESLEWGEDYIIRLYGDFAGYPHADYELQPEDWMGEDLNRFDTWVRSSAQKMEVYYATDLTTYVGGKGLVLNEEGGAIFANCISSCPAVRPGIFQISSSVPGYAQGDYAQTLQTGIQWQTILGPYITSAFTATGGVLNINGSVVGALLGFIFYAIVAGLAFPPGHAIAAISIPFVIMVAVWYTGLLPLVALGVVLALAAFFIIWQFWLKGG